MTLTADLQDSVDLARGEKRIAEILHPEPQPVIAHKPHERIEEGVQKQRKTRSDKGQPKKPPADPDAITLKVSIDQARKLAMALSAADADLASFVQDQIIAHLQKRLAALEK